MRELRNKPASQSSPLTSDPVSGEGPRSVLELPRAGLEQPGVRLQGQGLRCGWLSGRSAPSACPPLLHPPAACRCSPLGSASPQCHENSTCVCRPGFVGYKCDRCQDNFFLTADRARCQECPSCYALVKAEVSPPRPGPPTSCSSQPAPAPGWALNCPLIHSSQGFQGHQLPPPRAHPAPWLMPTCPSPAPQCTAAPDPFSCRPPRSHTFSTSTGMRPQTALGGTGQEGDAHAGHKENFQQGGGVVRGSGA